MTHARRRRCRVVALMATAGAAVACRYNVDLTGSPRPFLPQDTLASASEALPAATPRSRVGSVQLTIGGHGVDAPQAPGAGERLSLRGQDRDTFRIQTGVGNARLRIEARRPAVPRS